MSMLSPYRVLDLAAERSLLCGQMLLNDGERELLRLAYFSDLSQSEIAERTSVLLGTAKSRMRSGLIRLRGALERRVE